MTIYLGDQGAIELKRASGAPIQTTINVGDVNVDKRRFSFPQDVRGELINGDQVDLVRTDGNNLDFIQNHNDPDWRGYVFIDIMGGIRLYDSFEASIRGEANEAIPLKVPGTDQPIAIQTRNTRYNQLAQVQQFDFTTERESVDLTHLGDQFRQRYEAGLISGQGTLQCFWDHKLEMCDPNQCSDGVELPVYLAQLCIRLTQGADFMGRFFIYAPCGEDLRESRNSVWYEADCIVTNVSISVAPTEIIESSIDFVTTGTIRLLVGNPPSYLLTEEPAKLLQEDGSGLLLAGSD